MKPTKSLRLAFNILAHSKIRSWLSILGIVIGVASVLAILALSQGLQQSIEESLGGLGADIITVSPGYSKAMGAAGEFRGGGNGDRQSSSESSSTTDQKNLTNKDIQALKLIPNIKYIQGIVSGRADVGYLSESMSVSVTGVDPQVWKYMDTTGLDSGRYLSQGDSNVVVISYRLATEQFKEDIQLNNQITIEGKVFRVVGILKESSGGMGGSSGSIYMPIDTARTTLEDVGTKEFDSIQIKVKDVEQIDDTMDQIETRLMVARAVNERTKDFSVSSVKEMQETISSTISSMTLFLGAIAAISLLVGAIGIANTMFTTVLEKTKEIGIMKSIGAKNRDIMSIFLFNSSMIGLAGGILGGILGVIASKILLTLLMSSSGTGRMTITSMVVTPKTFLFVFGVSVLIGILAGVIPAYRASKMNPVDALRYE